MMTLTEMINTIKSDHEKAKALDNIGEVTTEITTSDKVGFNWKVYYVNGIEVRKEYIENLVAKGTKENPIYFAEGITLTPNTYYYYDEKLYVYMGEEKTATTFDEVADSMAEWYE